jgi:type II secretory pathway component PulL
MKDSDLKMLNSIKQLEYYKKMTEMLQRQNSELGQEKQRVINQLQSLFELYKKQKQAIDKLSVDEKDGDMEIKILKERVENYERLNSKLKEDLNKETELKNSKHSVRTNRMTSLENYRSIRETISRL